MGTSQITWVAAAVEAAALKTIAVRTSGNQPLGISSLAPPAHHSEGRDKTRQSGAARLRHLRLKTTF
jgi:hypothetical protein